MSAVPPYDPDAPGPAMYVYARVADHIAARIAVGELMPGTRLPGERDLAAEYGVALGTVRRAIEELRDRGLVVTLPAKGTYIARPEDLASQAD
ncbi:winged helix-turn-helix domain-containing protein [Herbidospora cretacea]|uniref:winged helix-turn-helix domain-containing protein n=1 Tax=Herbidospora cretacea TaxID=28444 RepID=UPI00068C7857|nr:winged helix-turn-helix domain-containing protein [Herbidospora cretacea]